MTDFPVCVPSVGKRRNSARVKLATTKLVAFPNCARGAAPRCRMSIMVLSFASSERSTRPREGLSGVVSIPRIINPLLEGFDPARRPLLFYVEFWPVAPLGDGSGSIVQIWLLRDRQFARTLLNRRKQLRQLPSAIAGYSRWSIMIPPRQRPFWCPRCLEELRRGSPRQRVSPRSETGRRAVARSASIVNQVR